VLAGPLYDKEGILYANLDLSEVIQSKLDFDGGVIMLDMISSN